MSWVSAAEVIPAADIFLSTSLNEGISFSLIEALSTEIPVVAVKAGSISEIVKDQENGFLTTDSVDEIVYKYQMHFNYIARINA
jgi:glycosyltransferase involved in cell wall biosynthesis